MCRFGHLDMDLLGSWVGGFLFHVAIFTTTRHAVNGFSKNQLYSFRIVVSQCLSGSGVIAMSCNVIIQLSMTSLN